VAATSPSTPIGGCQDGDDCGGEGAAATSTVSAAAGATVTGDSTAALREVEGVTDSGDAM